MLLKMLVVLWAVMTHVPANACRHSWGFWRSKCRGVCHERSKHAREHKNAQIKVILNAPENFRFFLAAE